MVGGGKCVVTRTASQGQARIQVAWRYCRHVNDALTAEPLKVSSENNGEEDFEIPPSRKPWVF